MTEARKKYLQMLLSVGKIEILTHHDRGGRFKTFGNEAMVGIWMDSDLRDKNARTRENTYMHGRFSVEVTKSTSWWRLSYWGYGGDGTWYCYMTRAGAIASGTKLDTES
jgi:hypothetical protein